MSSSGAAQRSLPACWPCWRPPSDQRVGGFITERYSWHWLFLINVPPGIGVALLVAWAVDIDRPDWRRFGSVDLLVLPLLAIFLGSLQVVLKEAPHRGWGSTEALLLAGVCVVCGVGVIRRSLRHPAPLIDLRAFRDRNFVVGCCFSFVLGIGLYGAVYLLPVYLGLVRDYGALSIGEIMMVTGAAQLMMAPVAIFLERRVDVRLLIAAGYALLAVGLIGNGFMTFETDFWGLFWQQLVRGSAVMLCLLPSTALALSGFDSAHIPAASDLFNLMRNLGGAIGLAMIDTVLEQRTPVHIAAIAARLLAGDPSNNTAAVYGHFRNVPRRSGSAAGMITMHLFQHGWFWMIPLPDDVTSVGLVGTRSFFRTRTEDLDSFFARAVAASPSVGERMTNAEPVAPLVATANYSYNSRCYAGDGYILIGDAAAFIDPLFSSGVMMAMSSAASAADVVHTWPDDRKAGKRLMRAYQRKLQRGLNSLSWLIYRINTPVLRDIFMASFDLCNTRNGLLAVLAGDFYEKPRLVSPLRRLQLAYGCLYLLSKLGVHLRVAGLEWERGGGRRS